MKLKTLALLMGFSAGFSLLTACDGTTPSIADINNLLNTPQTLQGSVFKGPIDQARIQVMDRLGNPITSIQSQQGTFQLPAMDALPDLVFIQSSSGQYVDEATGNMVNLTGQQGLRAVFTKAELQTILDQNQFIALTPETTLLAKLARYNMDQGIAPQQAINDAKNTIETQMLQGSNPTGSAIPETLLRTGNLSNTQPNSPQVAQARNRASAVSFEAKNLGLSPNQVFELITLRSQDLQDGQLDGMAPTQNAPLSITSTSSGGQTIALDQQNQATTYRQARNDQRQANVDLLNSGQLTQTEQTNLNNELTLLSTPPTQGGMTNQGGNGTQGGMTNQGGNGTQGGMTNQGGNGTQGGMTNQGGNGTQGGMTNQGGNGTQGGMTNQGGNGTQGGMTNQGGTGTQGGMTNQGGTGTQGGMTNQGGTGTQGGMTNQGGNGTQGGMTNQGGMGR